MPRTRGQAATAVDVPFLATTYDVPENDIQSLLDVPTAELVKSFLTSLTTKAQEFEALKTDKVKLEVELENTVRTAETKAKAQKTQLAKHVKEAEELRKKLNEAEAARETLASELDQLRSSTSGSTAEVEALRQRIETLEASNRDALALVESKSSEKDRVASELSEQLSKLLGLRKEISQLEEKTQSLENAATSQRFKEQTLQQEIELLKKNNDWHSNELQTRTQEHAKFRKERNAKIASLQRELDDSNANVETLKRTENSLRQRLEEVQGKADEAFARISSLQEDAARKEQDHRDELGAIKRLADLQAQSAATHKARLQEVQAMAEQIKEDAADEIGRLQAEVETERHDKEEAERKVAELELTVEKLEQGPRQSRPGTPMRNGAFDPQTPSRLGGSRAGSPSALPTSLRKTVNGLSFTQLYSQFTEAQQMLEHERSRTKKLQDALDDLITQMEERAPELNDMREERERLEQDVLSVSNLLDEANKVRDQALSDAQRWKDEAKTTEKQAELLKQQIRDLSAQIKMLVTVQATRDNGLDDMSMQERLDLERAARGEFSEEDFHRMTDTGRFIAERLVIFRNVSELQEKNMEMLTLVRSLGERLEGEEAQEKQRKTEAYASEIDKLKEHVSRLQDELQMTVTQIDTYTKERNMMRRMLQHRGQLPADEGELQNLFGQSVPPATPSRGGNGMEPPTPRSKDVEDLNKLLREQQSFFDQYRNETANDRRTMKEQVDALARDKSNLQADVAKLQSQLELAGGRYEMLQSNINGIRSENQELQKRAQSMAEQAARQDLRTQQVAEELVEARSLAESLRNENANAKAEKDLWKRIEVRLTEDNKNLMDERSRLSKLVTDLQNLQNERELADSESRRRTQSRLEALESELSETKRKLEHQVDENKKLSMRREYEENQSRQRIDDLVKSLGNVREELVAAITTRDTLQARFDEMRIELRSAEEKVAALQPRPTPGAPIPAQAETNGDAQNEDLPAEQRLAIEVSDLKRDLELARNELESAKQSIEQYRHISQSAEEELASINETSDQFREEMDRQLSEKNAQIAELEQRISDLNAELTSTNTEMSELRTKAADADRALSEQKAGLDSEIARLKDDSDRWAAEKAIIQEDLKAQANIAQKAQQSYEDELVKHAEAAKTLQAVRQEYNELRTEVAVIRAEAEAAKASLERGEESWSEQKERFERELEALKRRREEGERQNKLLHQQMENFSAELQTLRQGRAAAVASSAGGEGEEGTGATNNGDSGNLQEVIRYLRREKEIVDVQYEISLQEGKRLQQQLDYTTTQLEDVKEKLAEERRRDTERAASESSTNRLQQTLNELNLYRESTTTLRNENRVALQRVEEQKRENERLLSEIEPLKSRVGELEGELEGRDGEIELLRKDRDHYQERVNTILSKYDRVDPAEHEALKTRVQELEAEIARLEAERAPLQEQIDGAQAKYEAQESEWVARLDKFKNQAKEQNRKQNTEKTDLRAERDRLYADLEVVRGELEKTKGALTDAQQNKTDGAEEGEVDEGAGAEGEEHAELHQRIAEAEGRAAEHVAKAAELEGEIETLRGRIAELEGEVVGLRTQVEAAQQQQTVDGMAQAAGADNETLDKLRQDLATAQQEVETLRASATVGMTEIAPMTGTEGEASAAQQVQAAVDLLRAEMQAQHELALKQKDDECTRRIDNARTNLNNKLREGREAQREEARKQLLEQNATEIQKLKEEHEAAIQRMREAHEAELERLRTEGAQAVEKAGGEEASAPAASSVNVIKPEEGADMATLELNDAQVTEFIKKNARANAILKNNIQNGINKRIEPLNEQIKEKDAEIERLKAEIAELQSKQSTDSAPPEDVKPAPETAPDDTSALESQIADLKAKLDAAEEDKKTAVEKAKTEAAKLADLKSRAQQSQQKILQAKYATVKLAAEQTPQRPVKEVVDEAEAKKVAPAAAAPAQKPAAVPSSPAAPSSAAPSSSAAPPSSTGLSEEEAKLKARQERFGTANAGSHSPSRAPSSPATGTSGKSSAPTGSFGQPSAPTGSFGQPSGAMGQPARRPSGAAPNPSAPAFTPGNSADQQPQQQQRANVGTGPAALRGLSSGIPRGGASGLPRGSGAARGGAGLSIQGAASAGGQQRGGMQSGLPRGGANNAGARGGRGGGIPRGGQQNAGQKRPHDGDGGAGDGKRNRGGGAAGGG